MPDLLVLTGPPIGRPPLPAATRLAAPILARLLPTLELSNGLHRDQLSRDPSVGARYHGDALVYPRSTARLGNELFTAMSAAERELTRGDPLPVPTLVLHGSEDSIASPANARPLREIANCEYRLLPGLRHEVLNEPEGPEVVDQIAAWIRSNVEELALRPVGPAAPGPAAAGPPAPGPAAPGSPASADAASTAAGR